MKLLKTIGKVIALPFDLALILGKLLLIPIKLVSVLLRGEFTEWDKKRKFIVNSIKEMFKAFKHNKIILSYIQQDLRMKTVISLKELKRLK